VAYAAPRAAHHDSARRTSSVAIPWRLHNGDDEGDCQRTDPTWWWLAGCSHCFARATRQHL